MVNTTSGRTTNLHQKRLFTTGEAALICGVSQQTIIRCFDRGDLKGFRVPGSKFRRIPREALIEFMRANDMDTAALSSCACSVLMISADEQLRQMARKALRQAGCSDADLATADCVLEAGVLLGANRHATIIIDPRMDGGDGPTALNYLRKHPDLQSVHVIVILEPGHHADKVKVLKAGADCVLERPVQQAQLNDHLGKLVQ